MHKNNTYTQSNLDYPATLHGRLGTTDDLTTTVPPKKVMVSHSLIAIGAVGVKSPTVSWEQLIKGGAHPSPFPALAFPNSKKVPIYC